MQGKTRKHGWLGHVAVALAYAVGYLLLREVTFSHWILYAGFRLAVLLLAPYRYWPALLVGEVAALATTGVACAGEYGWLWAAAFMVPPMALAMPIAHAFRKQGRLFPTRTTTDMNAVLLCTLLVSVLWSAMNLATLALMRVPPDGRVLQYGAVAGRYFLGNYLGALTFVPLALLAREELIGTRARRIWSRVSESRLAMESISLLVPALALLGWLAATVPGDVGETARVAMFLPVAWLSLRHGWRGAAVGGTAASIAVVLVMPALYDQDTLRAQVFVAFTITTMLLLGARIATLHVREGKERGDLRAALAMAQRNVSFGEMRLRQTSYALEQMGSSIQSTYNQLLGRLRHQLPGVDERNYYRQAAATEQQIYRLADTLYPLVWQERGLPAALREGSLPRALDEAGIGYWCDIGGSGLSELSKDVHMALYRLACDAIACACAKRNIRRITVRLRGRKSGARRWALLQVDSEVDEIGSRQVRWDSLMPMPGSCGADLGALRDRAGLFEGKARLRSTAHGERISLILWDPS